MPHLSWDGNPRGHWFASSRVAPFWSGRRALAVLVAGCVVAAACTGDDTDSTDAAPVEPIEPSAPVSSTTPITDPAVELAADAAPVESTTRVTDSPPTTEAIPPRCGDNVEPSGPVTLQVWHGLSGNAAEFYIHDVVARFEAEHPGITVELTKGDVNYPGGTTDFASSDSRPDVLHGSNLTTRAQADSGLFVPIEECGGGQVPSQFDDLLPAIDLTYRVDGTLWAAPYNVSTPLLMYDGNVWREAGLDPDDPPATIDELIDTAQALHDSGVVAHGLVLYNKSALWLITETAAKEGRLIVEPDNGHGVEQIELVPSLTDETIELLVELRQLKGGGVIDWTEENFNDEDLIALVTPLEGSGMTLHTSAALGDIFRLVDAGAIGEPDVRVAPLPGPGPGATPGGGAWWLTDGDDPDRIAAAWQFIDWMTQPEQVADMAAYTGYVPTTPTAAALPVTVDSWEEYPQLEVAYDQVAATPGTPAAVGVQVGPLVEFFQAIELGAAYVIDMGNDPRSEMPKALENALLAISAYGDG